MEEFNYKITASTLKEFKEIEEKLQLLPNDVKRGLSNVSMGLVGINCKVKDDFKKPQLIVLPDTVGAIKQFDDTTLMAYMDGFIFEIKEDYPGKTTKQYNYVFVPMEAEVGDATNEREIIEVPYGVFHNDYPTVAMHRHNKIVFHRKSDQKELLKYVKEMLPSWEIVKKFNFK